MEKNQKSQSTNGRARPKPVYSSPQVTLYRGDCLAVLADLPAASVDTVITDPPYATINRFGEIRTNGWGKNGTRRLQFDWDNPEVACAVALRLAASIRLVNVEGSAFVFCGFDSAAAYSEPFRRLGFTVKPAAWVKKCPPPAAPGNWWPSAFELAFYGYRKRAWFGDHDAKRANVFVSDSYCHGQPGKVKHPTQKPLALVERIVTALCPPGGVVLDPFLGSGTTALACLRTGRRCIGIEKDAKYLRIAVRRLRDATN